MTTIPFDDRDGFIWIDGEMLPWREAKIHFLTHGFHYGTEVFEGERAYNGHIFKSTQHSKRLIKSANLIKMDVRYDVDDVETIKKDVLKANNLTNGYVRAAIWRGSEQMGIDISETKSHMAIAAWEWGSYFDPKARDTGISLHTCNFAKLNLREDLAQSKCGGFYVLSTIAKAEAQKAGFTDALMLDQYGDVAESTGANLFAIKDGNIHTPIADRFLNGITRQTIIELANHLNINLIERRIKPEELDTFEEIFLTGSAAEITAVGKIDEIEYTVGSVTKKLRTAYEDLVNNQTG